MWLCQCTCMYRFAFCLAVRVLRDGCHELQLRSVALAFKTIAISMVVLWFVNVNSCWSYWYALEIA